MKGKRAEEWGDFRHWEGEGLAAKRKRELGYRGADSFFCRCGGVCDSRRKRLGGAVGG